MLRSLLVGTLAGILALPPVALAAPPPRGSPPRLSIDATCKPLAAPRGTIPWETGERLSYDIDVVGARAGKLSLVALPPVGKGDSAEYSFRALAASNSFFSKIRRVRGRSTAIVRARDLHPRRYEETSQEGKLDKAATVVFKRPNEGKRIEIDYRRNTARRKYRFPYLHEAFDPVSIVYYLRTLDFQKGMPICFDAYSLRKLWRVSGKVVGLETVKVPAGVFQAWHIEGVAVRTDDPKSRREVHIWISDDERRLPVASLGVIDLGAVRAQLTHVDKGSAADSEDGLLGEETAGPAEPVPTQAPTAAPTPAIPQGRVSQVEDP